MAPPELPTPAYSDVDSLLSRKFGREVANYFSASPLNRISFLRADYKFLSTAFNHSSTKFLLFKDLGPLTKSPSELAYASTSDVMKLVGENPFGLSEQEQLDNFKPSHITPQLAFLGLDERTPDIKVIDRYAGTPYFAIDVTPRAPYEVAATALAEHFTAQGNAFIPNRMHLSLTAPEAAIYAEGRHLLDWHSRNPYCASCGSLTISVHGGWKRACPATQLSESSERVERPACGTRAGVSNLSFPRTDAVIIVAVVSADGTRVLLGRQPRWPKLMYSTLAGFLEPGESLEEAVRREVWEEAGVKLGRVVIHSTQPWPYPANIMIGAVAQATPDGENVDLGNDPELEDAKWWTVDEVREALKHGTRGLGPSDQTSQEYKEGSLVLPPRTAIANQLVESVCNGGFMRGVTSI
jgi:NAD+ diphosphatase